MTTAFVLGGGGVLGAVEVGMLRALSDAGVRPDLVFGTSVGAINGAVLAASPASAADRLTDLWHRIADSPKEVVGAAPVRTLLKSVTSGTHAYSAEPLRALLTRELGELDFAHLDLPLAVCAAHIESAGEHWFTSGPVIDAVLASSAVPGLLPVAEVDGQHYLDGGIVNSVPLGRAVDAGATEVYVLQVGRLDRPLSPPRWPWEVARVSFEIARRHRFVRELAELPEHVTCHVLPARGTAVRDDSILSSTDYRSIERRIDQTYAAAIDYLDEHR